MINKIFISIPIVLAFAFFAHDHNVVIAHSEKVSADSSFIYVYRSGQIVGALTKFAIYVDNMKLCKLSNGKYFRIPVSKGTHIISAHRGGIGIGKKETQVDVDVEPGKSYYISCTIVQSITRVRLEMQEVMPRTGLRDIEIMKIDRCQGEVVE